MALLLALTTVATQAQAEALATQLLEARLVACAQLQPITALYRWQGALQHEAEWRLLLKTTDTAWPALQAAVRALHPYDTPALLAWPATQADPAFAQWVADEVGPAAPS